MTPSRNEHTIAAACEVRGRGYWSGREVRVLIEPARIGTGVVLVRGDLASEPSCPASIEFRNDADLRTNLRRGEASFAMIEHLIAALAAMEIDNCVVTIDGEEFPGLDGSSEAYVNALREAGLIVQAKAKSRLVIQDTIRIQDQGRWIEASPSTDGRNYFEYRLQFNDDTPIAPQTFGLVLTPYRFIHEVSRARTFVTQSQAETLRARGLASHVTNHDLLVIGQDGPLENELRFPDECARHKTLDMIGDLALAGVEIVGRIVSFRGGHNLNGMMAARLAQLAAAQIKQNQSQPSSAQQYPAHATLRRVA